MFRADQSAFMCGLAICQYLNENFDEYIKDGQLSVGAFGGTPIPTVTVFMGGLQLGI
jgi:basic membrane lipoprotein Med (substrate-binding protein (PBP1-ABC) superfamily)